MTPARRRRRSGGGAGAGLTQTYDFTAAMPPAFQAAWAGPTAYTSGYPAYETMSSGFAAGAIAGGAILRRDGRGLRLEPAVTNIATNARMLGGTPAVTSTLQAGQTIAVGGITAVAVDSNLFRCVTPAAHGLSTFDRVYFQTTFTCAGETFTTSAGREVTIRVIDATTFEFYYHRRARSLVASNVAVTYQFRTWTATGTLPSGMSLRGDSGGSRLFRFTGQTDPSNLMTPFPIACTKVFNISGTGTDYAILANFAVSQGDAISYSQVAHILSRRGGANDDQSKNNLGLSIAFIQKNGAGTQLSETLVEQLSCITTGINQARIAGTAVMDQATVASVDIALKLEGASFCDLDLELREMMVSKTRHRASPVLPAWNTQATASVAAATCAGVATPWAARGLTYQFESKEIVSALDTILSTSGFEVQASGLAFPRDIIVTDGANSVTLVGALRDNWPTQQLASISVSVGPGGIRASFCDDFLRAPISGSAPYAGGAFTSVSLNEASGGLRRGMSTAKRLTLCDTERSLAQVIAASRLSDGAAFAVPGVDTIVGRNSANPLWVPSTAEFTARGIVGSVVGQKVNITGSNQTIQDMDMRGFYILQGTNNVVNITFRNCLFDQALHFNTAAVSYTISQQSFTGCTGWQFENCEFEPNLAAISFYQTYLSLTSPGCAVRRCIFRGSGADHVKCNQGMTVEDCIFTVTNALGPGTHADMLELGLTSLEPTTIRRVIGDFRKVYGVCTEPNTMFGGSVANVGATAAQWTLPVTIDGVVGLGGYNTVAMSTPTPNTASATLTGLYLDGARHDLSNIRIGMTPNLLVNISLGGSQMVFTGAAVTIANVAGRVGCQNCLGLMAGTWADGWRAGSIMTTGQASKALTSTALNALGSPMLAGDAFSINGQTITVLASGAAGNNQINVTDTIATLIAKMQALVPGLTVTLSDYRYTATAFTDYFSGAALG